MKNSQLYKELFETQKEMYEQVIIWKDFYDFIFSYYDEVFYSEFNEENLIISLIIDYFIKMKNPKYYNF